MTDTYEDDTETSVWCRADTRDEAEVIMSCVCLKQRQFIIYEQSKNEENAIVKTELK